MQGGALLSLTQTGTKPPSTTLSCSSGRQAGGYASGRLPRGPAQELLGARKKRWGWGVQRCPLGWKGKTSFHLKDTAA